MFRGSVKGTGYPLHSPVSHSLPLPCVTVCHHISIGVYKLSGPKKKKSVISAAAQHLLEAREQDTAQITRSGGKKEKKCLILTNAHMG